MSNVTSSAGSPDVLEHLVQCLSDQQLSSYITVASTGLIFHDCSLMHPFEFTFIWRWSRTTYTRILFIGARYVALAWAILNFSSAVAVESFMNWLVLIVITCSELILATRAWAIWGRSRTILAILIGLITVFAALAITVIQLDLSGAPPSVTWHIEGVGQCQVTAGTVPYMWVAPFVAIIVFEAVVLALTLYKILQYNRHIQTHLRSKLVNALWIDGVMYFVFMFVIGVLNIGVSLIVSRPQLRAGTTQLQMAFHSILSTRVVIHTATVLRQDIVDSRATVARHQRSTRIRFAENIIELEPEGEEFQEAPSTYDAVQK
ncbi:hypothetical protein BJV74DRAFT_542418 [Russula compacta]|nr:hypothetical protein BJV74DRAFT_542418 [Russula compacta]